MYLESVLVLSKTNQTVRAVDVADYLSVSKPAVSRATSKLKNSGYLGINDDGSLYLTEKGNEEAIKIYDRHKMLTEFLLLIGVDEKTASADACKMEHVISDATYEAMKQHNLSHKRETSKE